MRVCQPGSPLGRPSGLWAFLASAEDPPPRAEASAGKRGHVGVGEELMHVHSQHLWFHLRSASSREHLYVQVSPPGGMSRSLVPFVLRLDYFQKGFLF